MAAEWKTGDTLEGRWEIRRVMKGGMGIVYVVYDREWKMALAAKTFQDTVFGWDRSIKPLFLKEALAWVQLGQHVNVAHADFVQEIEGRPVLFLEYVSGGDLSEWIGDKRLTEDAEEVLRLGLQFCDGMLHAQAHGIEVHRDIKPRNCLMTALGNLKITDFGLAKVLTEASEAGSARPGAIGDSGSVVGTPTHMAPEQFIDSKNVTVAADIYSFGVMLYQMATGQLPFGGVTWEDYEKAHWEQAADLNLVRLPALRALVQECLAKEPANRPRDFQEVRMRLADVYQSVTGKAAYGRIASIDPDADQLLNKGASLAALGFDQQAMECYDEVLARRPNSGEAWANKGNLQSSAGRLEEALTCYDKAISLNRRLSLAWYSRGGTLDRLGRLAEARDSLLQAILLQPRLARAWGSLGVVLKQLGETSNALNAFDKALEIDERHAGAWANKANLLLSLGRLDEALRCATRAVELEPHQHLVWYNRGNIHLARHQLEEAFNDFDRALEIAPDFAEARIGQGKVLLAYKRPELALAYYDAVTRSYPQLAEGWYNRALVLDQLERWEEALPAIEQALMLAPGDTRAWMRKGALLAQLQEMENARAAYQQACAVDPGDAVAWHNLGVHLRAMGLPEEAWQAAAKAVSLNTSEDVLLLKANLEADLGRVDEALASYDRLLAAHPGFATGWFNKAATLTNAERYQEAIANYEKAAGLGYGEALEATRRCRELLETPTGTVHASPRRESADEWHDEGVQRIANNGSAMEALECFERALAQEPNRARSWWGKALALDRLSRVPEAIAAFDEAIRLDPTAGDLWTSKGAMFYSRRRYAEALACYETARELGDMQAWQGSYLCREAMGEWK